MLLTCFMKMCELPVIYHTFFVNYITSRNIYSNIIFYFLCYSGWYKSLLKNVYNGNMKEHLLYVSAFILCCYGYQTGDNSELQTVILWSMMVLFHFATWKCSFKTTLFSSSFLTIEICQFLIITMLRWRGLPMENLHAAVWEF